ncbi:MAG: hypothetical protein RJA70_2117 [Pseudomonadota bacterium]|jgi:MraZ protein
MFRGQFHHSIDQKGRTSLPSRFREVLDAEGDLRLILTPAPFDPCLHLYPLKAWEDFERKVAELPSLDPDIARFRRLYISPALDVEVDKAGRIRIGSDFREKANITGEVFWAGMGRIVELWSKDLWDRNTAMNDEQFVNFQSKVQELIRI